MSKNFTLTKKEIELANIKMQIKLWVTMNNTNCGIPVKNGIFDYLLKRGFNG